HDRDPGRRRALQGGRAVSARTATRRGFGLARALVLLALGATAAGAAEDDRVLVLTALPAVYSVSTALAAGTAIEVRNVPEGGRPPAAQASYFAAQAERLAPLLADADAGVARGKLWSRAPLYAAARAANRRVVDISATEPRS